MTLCDHQDLDESRKQKIQQSLIETEEQWGAALQTAEDVLNKVKTQTLLDQDLAEFKIQNEEIQAWIQDQEMNLQSVTGQMEVEEKLQAAQVRSKSKVPIGSVCWFSSFLQSFFCCF